MLAAIITLVGISGCGLTVARGGGGSFVEGIHCADVSRNGSAGGRGTGGGYQGYVVHFIAAEQVRTALHKLWPNEVRVNNSLNNTTVFILIERKLKKKLQF